MSTGAMAIIEPKILKGTRDFGPEDMAKRDFVMAKIRRVFERYGFDTIETPVLNYAETILGKYGEEGDRLTYHFDDAGERHIALPYDLTVPTARFVAAHWHELAMPFRRYQIQRVWRAEKPQKGRLREFYQCDIDVIGTQNLLAEADIARVIVDVFDALDLNAVRIKVNSRRLMNAVLDSLKVKGNHLDLIRIIDKRDKIGEDGVRAELVKLGVSSSACDELFAVFESRDFQNYDTSEIDEFMTICGEYGIGDRVEFDPYLARGLDYYTGMIYEVVLDAVPIGSLCGGGRYDDLCGLFSKEKFSGVGVAFGFERIILVLEELGKLSDIALNSQILVTLFDEATRGASLALANQLRAAGMRAEVYMEPAKLAKQFKYADKKRIPFVVTCGPDEVAAKSATIKNMQSGEQIKLSLYELPAYFQSNL